MDTKVIVLGEHPDDWTSALKDAADVLKKGGLVAFPTETVYGLGANALDANAVAKIYEAKGRPAKNPIIVHVHSIEQAKELTLQWPEAADSLTQAFWPGALTLILPKNDTVPSVVTAGGATVAVRMPSHGVARMLLVEAGIPIAAPSANRSEHLSATTARHVLKGLDGRIDLLLDQGPTPGGLESTVVDCTVLPVVIRRPGLIPRAAIEAVLPVGNPPEPSDDSALVSPGMMARHYAPDVPLQVIAHGNLPLQCDSLTGLLLLENTAVPDGSVLIERLPADPLRYAAGLYAALHRLEEENVGAIFVEEPPTGDAWIAVHDRLTRASAK